MLKNIKSSVSFNAIVLFSTINDNPSGILFLSLLEMAWFHQALQGSGQPDGSMMPPTVEDLSDTQVSEHTITQLGMSDGQGWSTLRTVSITDFPPASGGIVPQRLDALSCTSLNMGSREDSVPLSFVTLQEQRCVLSWFLGWNAVQKQRFLEDLISKAVPGKVSSLLDQFNTLQVFCFILLIYVKLHADVNKLVPSSAQTLRNLALNYLLTKASSSVNGCRQNERSDNVHKTSQLSTA